MGRAGDLQTLGQYEVSHRISDDGLCTTYLGRDPRFNREVRVVVLQPHLRRDPSLVKRFRAEAAVQAGLNHPYIAKMLDIVVTDDLLAAISEHPGGRPLPALIPEVAASKDVARTVSLMRSLLATIGYAHACGVVHKGLRPSRILVEAVPSHEYVKVLDFGIAGLFSAADLGSASPEALGYLAPEQVTGSSIDHRADVYALGTLMFELLAGRRPFHADSAAETLKLIAGCPAPDLRTSAPGVSGAVAAVVARALATDAAGRFASCEEMEQALSAPAAAPPASAWVAAAPRTRTAAGDARTRLGIAAAAFAAILAMSAGGVALVRHRAASRLAAERAAIAAAETEKAVAEEQARAERVRQQIEQERRDEERQRAARKPYDDWCNERMQRAVSLAQPGRADCWGRIGEARPLAAGRSTARVCAVSIGSSGSGSLLFEVEDGSLGELTGMTEYETSFVPGGQWLVLEIRDRNGEPALASVAMPDGEVLYKPDWNWP
jgi:serine/threonine-protein kinase